MTKTRFLQEAGALADKNASCFTAGGQALSDEFNSHSCPEKILSRVLLVQGHLLAHIILKCGQRGSNLLMSCRMNLVRKGSVPVL